jgi:hypothetical protein
VLRCVWTVARLRAFDWNEEKQWNVVLSSMQTWQLSHRQICEVCGALPFSPATYLRESARVHIAAPNNTTSLTRNWPGDAASAGNPYPACHTPGVVMTKLSVVKNIPIPVRLPAIESFGQTGPAAISNAMAISIRRDRARNLARPGYDKPRPGVDYERRG